MPKIHYSSNKFSKVIKPGGSPPPAPLSLQYWCPEVRWFDQIVIFQADCDEIELQKISYDVIFATSSLLRQSNDVTKITSQNFLFWTPNQNFWLRQCLAEIWFFSFKNIYA